MKLYFNVQNTVNGQAFKEAARKIMHFVWEKNLTQFVIYFLFEQKQMLKNEK